MLTVKLRKGHTSKILTVKEVNIYSPVLEGGFTGNVREIAGTLEDGESFAFFIVNPDNPMPENRYGFAPEVDFWSCAYVENPHGATTEIVRAF